MLVCMHERAQTPWSGQTKLATIVMKLATATILTPQLQHVLHCCRHPSLAMNTYKQVAMVCFCLLLILFPSPCSFLNMILFFNENGNSPPQERSPLIPQTLYISFPPVSALHMFKQLQQWVSMLLLMYFKPPIHNHDPSVPRNFTSMPPPSPVLNT